MDTKQRLLELFENNKGKYLSGEEIARTLSVSRAAVWKAVKSLISDGYDIDAIRNKGYALSEQTDIISAQGIAKYLWDGYRDLEIEVHPTLVSTNSTARERAIGGAKERVVIAASQTGGRGRLGRSFYSPEGSGIYMSLLLRPSKYTTEQAASLTTMAAVAVCEAIEAVSGKDARIKWVNDVFMGGKKVCGILTEASIAIESGLLDYAILGIGINVVSPSSIPPELQDIIGAVFDTPPVDAKNRLAAEVINRFMSYYSTLDLSYSAKYRKRCMVIGKQIDVIRGQTRAKATALDVDDECHLIVKYDDGSVQALSSGEISVRLTE